jgi:hypothetical protein
MKIVFNIFKKIYKNSKKQHQKKPKTLEKSRIFGLFKKISKKLKKFSKNY